MSRPGENGVNVYTWVGILLLIGPACARRADAQTLVHLNGPAPHLRVALTNGEVASVNTEARIMYKLQDVPTKITVHTTCPGQTFELFVRATDLRSGVPAGLVHLDDGRPPMDLIVNIPPGTRMEHGTLRYTATARISQGNSDEEGMDTHVVTYTLVEQ